MRSCPFLPRSPTMFKKDLLRGLLIKDCSLNLENGKPLNSMLVSSWIFSKDIINWCSGRQEYFVLLINFEHVKPLKNSGLPGHIAKYKPCCNKSAMHSKNIYCVSAANLLNEGSLTSRKSDSNEPLDEFDWANMQPNSDMMPQGPYWLMERGITKGLCLHM